jgi:hypothetical protein
MVGPNGVFGPGTIIMSDFRRLKSSVLVWALALATAGTGWATISACPTTATGSALSSFPVGNTPASGCGNVDLGFNTFAASGSVYTTTSGTATTLSTTLVDIYSPTGPAPSGSTQGAITNDFDVPGTANWTLDNGNGRPTTSTSTVTYVATVENGVAGVTAPTNGRWAIDALNVAASYAALPTGTNSIVINELICAGATTTTGCPTADGATITETITAAGVAYSISSLTGTGFTFNAATGLLNLNAGFIQVAISNSVVLTRATGTNVGPLTSFSNTFDQEAIPEPSTFILLGSMLAGIGALRLRKPMRS